MLIDMVQINLSRFLWAMRNSNFIMNDVDHSLSLDIFHQ